MRGYSPFPRSPNFPQILSLQYPQELCEMIYPRHKRMLVSTVNFNWYIEGIRRVWEHIHIGLRALWFNTKYTCLPVQQLDLKVKFGTFERKLAVSFRETHWRIFFQMRGSDTQGWLGLLHRESGSGCRITKASYEFILWSLVASCLRRFVMLFSSQTFHNSKFHTQKRKWKLTSEITSIHLSSGRQPNICLCKEKFILGLSIIGNSLLTLQMESGKEMAK